MIKEFLSKLGANTKTTVGVSVSPGIGLEMIEIDRVTKTVSKYACCHLDYNYTTREIEDYDQFRDALLELFNTLHIPPKSNVILNLPTVHFGVATLPLLLGDDAVTNAIISEAEQSYIFKRQEPVVSWIEGTTNIETETKNLIYSALQQSVIDKIGSVFMEVGCTLLAIETSYASLLKTLSYTDLASDQMKEDVSWNLMVINQNSYSIISLLGKKIVGYYEEPLALKSFVDDEIYNAIISSSQMALQNMPATYLYIVSETDYVSAEVLSMKIPFEGIVKFLECNKYIRDELMQVNLNILPNMALKITPEAIGVGIYQLIDFPIRFNLTGEKNIAIVNDLSADYCPRITVGNLEIELTPSFISKVSVILGLIILIPALILYAFTYFASKHEQTKLDELNLQIEDYKLQLKKYENINVKETFDATSEINNAQSQTRSKLLYYSAIGINKPSKLWLTYMNMNSQGGIDIKGRSTDMASIYAFYKELKQSITSSDISLQKLEMAGETIDDVVNSSSSEPKYYEFEITNGAASAPDAAGAPAPAQSQPAASSTPKASTKKPLFNPPPPIFGSKNEQQNLPPNLEEIQQ